VLPLLLFCYLSWLERKSETEFRRMCSENAGENKKNKIDSKLERSSLMRFPKVGTLQLRINSIRSTKNSMISTVVPADFGRIIAIYV